MKEKSSKELKSDMALAQKPKISKNFYFISNRTTETIYEGYWKNNKKYGLGTYKIKEKDREITYEGEYYNGVI